MAPEVAASALHTASQVIPIVSQLHELLEVARRSKPSSAIEPALVYTDVEDSINRLATLMSSVSEGSKALEAIDAKESHAAFETAARQVLYEELAAHSIDEPDFVNVWNLLDILQFCTDKGLCDPSLVLWFMEEFLDTQTIDGCRKVFDYLESRREQLIAKAFTTTKQKIVLRACNELLRRLSRAEDTVFCGRVYIFMFQSFPLGDKSAVNLRGEFHVENITTFDATPASKTEDEMIIDSQPSQDDSTASKDATDEKEAQQPEVTTTTTEGPEKDQDKDKDKKQGDGIVDVETLYPIFWTLQEVFSNPLKVFNTESFDEFKKGLELTIQKFKSMPRVLQSHGPSQATENGKQGTKRKRNGSQDEYASAFNPKYLTSRDLFELELSDLTFQRHILVQALILIDFLLSLTPKSKKKLLQLKAQRAMQYDFTLGEEDQKWATSMRATIASYLQEGPDGKFYYRMVGNVLARDKGWVRWKVENCPAIELPAISADNFAEAMAVAQKASANKRLRATPLGSMDLNFLSEAENARGLQKLQDPARYTPPSTETLVKEVATAELDMDFADGAEKEALVAVKQNSTWRALRIASKSRFSVFDKVEDGKSLEVLIEPAAELPTIEIHAADAPVASVETGDGLEEKEGDAAAEPPAASDAAVLEEDATGNATPTPNSMEVQADAEITTDAAQAQSNGHTSPAEPNGSAVLAADTEMPDEPHVENVEVKEMGKASLRADGDGPAEVKTQVEEIVDSTAGNFS